MDIDQATPSASVIIFSRNTAGMPGTIGSHVLRVLQFVAAAVALLLLVTSDDTLVMAGLGCMTVVVATQCIWSIGMAVHDAFSLLTGRMIQARRFDVFFLVLDVVISTALLVSVAAVWGIFSLFRYDYNNCDENDCRRFQAVAMAGFVCWILMIPSCFLELLLVIHG